MKMPNMNTHYDLKGPSDSHTAANEVSAREGEQAKERAKQNSNK